jgi:hypothetical protein
MNRKQMVVANVQYKKPTLDDAKRQKGLLRYLTYRDGRTGHIRQQGGVERWHDLGLGHALQEVAQRCEAYKGDHVLAWTLVLNVNPELMHMVPLDQREQFVCALTEQTLTQFFEARSIPILSCRVRFSMRAPDSATTYFSRATSTKTISNCSTGQRKA